VTKRLFFALWPDSETRTALTNVSRQSGLDSQRLIPGHNLHITIEFLGQVDEGRTKVLIEAASQITVPCFSLLIDSSGWWETARVAWLAPVGLPEELLELYRQLHQLAVESDIPVQERPYRPHITLARKVNALDALEFGPVHWNVRDFCLVESNTLPEGAEYRIIRRWPLT